MTNPCFHRKTARASRPGEGRRQATLLDAGEERNLPLHALADDNAARELLVTSHRRFVVKIARCYPRVRLPPSDLVQERNP